MKIMTREIISSDGPSRVKRKQGYREQNFASKVKKKKTIVKCFNFISKTFPLGICIDSTKVEAALCD